MTGRELSVAEVEDLRLAGDGDGLIRALSPVHPPVVRRAAAAALGDLVDPRAVEPLIGVLGEKEGETRLAAVLALAKIADRGAVPALLAVFSDPHTPVRDAVAWALGAMKDGRAVKPLIKALSDPEWHVRMEAEWALLEIGEPSVEPLIAALHDEGVRWKAAGVLVKLGPVALEPLQEALKKTTDPNIRQGGEWAVRKILDLRAKMTSPEKNAPG